MFHISDKITCHPRNVAICCTKKREEAAKLTSCVATYAVGMSEGFFLTLSRKKKQFNKLEITWGF